MALYFSGTDYRASISTNGLDQAAAAPEVDHAVQAPERGRESNGLEVAPGLDAQVLYSSWPPEAIENLRSARAYSPRPVAQVRSSQKSRTARLVVALAVLVLVAIALSVGLGVGLTRRKQDSESSNTLSITTTTMAPIPTATPRVLPQSGIRSNTSLAAVTIAGGDRHLFFQEASGGLQRAFYSSRTKRWRSSVDSMLASGAKNNTPLVAATILNRPDTNRDEWSIILFYVTAANNLDCLEWYQGREGMVTTNCSDLALPSTQVAPDSQQISAHWDTALFDFSSSILFLQYRDLSRQVVTLSGAYNGTGDWYWRDYTNTLDQIMERSYQALSRTSTSRNGSTFDSPSTMSRLSDLNIAQPCNGLVSSLDQSTVFTMTCSLTNSFLATFNFFPHNASQNNATKATDVAYLDSHTGHIVEETILASLEMPTLRHVLLLDMADAGKDPPDSNLDIVPLFKGYDADNILDLPIPEAFLKQTNLTTFKERRQIPTPDSTFPYPRLASTHGDSTTSTFGDNTTNTYLYHQLDNSVLVEDTWDGNPNSFWISKNITIDTHLLNPAGT